MRTTRLFYVEALIVYIHRRFVSVWSWHQSMHAKSRDPEEHRVRSRGVFECEVEVALASHLEDSRKMVAEEHFRVFRLVEHPPRVVLIGFSLILVGPAQYCHMYLLHRLKALKHSHNLRN